MPTTYTATVVNAGSAPVYQWRKNATNVGTNSSVYTDAGLVNGDIITCRVTSSMMCATPVPAVSNSIVMNVFPVVQASVNVTVSLDSTGCEGQGFVFSTNIVNGGTNPQYKWFVNGSAVPGAVQHNFAGNTFSDKDVVTCELSSSLTCAFPTASNSIGMHIIPAVEPTVKIGGYPDATGITFYSTVTDGGTNPTYQWRKNGVDIPGATQPTYHSEGHQPTDKITLFVHSSVQCANPEFVLSTALQPMQVTAVGNVQGAVTDISLFPNPNNGRFTIKGDVRTNETLLLEVVNPLGQVIYRGEARPDGGKLEKQIDLDDKAAGIYLLNIKSENAIIPLRFIMNK
jgi:hypothetical protein